MKFVVFCSLFFIHILSFSQELTLVINPGHGGKDPGNLSSSKEYLDEKGLNLLISKKIARYIEENIPGIKVLLTRNDDSFMSLDEIVSFSNKNNADYMISIHCNANDNSKVSGASVHYHNENSKTSKLLSSYIENDLRTRAKRHSRGVKNAEDRHHNLQILWQTKMPAILVECGFMSNVKEEAYLNTELGQDYMASSIYRGFKDFVNAKHPNRVVGPYYSIRLSSSVKKLKTDEYQFKKVGLKIIEKDLGKENKYRFIYFAGKFDNKKKAEEVLATIRKSTGFKDAFVVKLNS